MLRRRTVLLTATCLLLVAVAAQGPVTFGPPRFDSSPQLMQLFGTVGHDAPVTAPEGANVTPSEPTGPDNRPGWTIIVLVSAAAAAACGTAYFLWRRLRRPRRRPVDRSVHSQPRGRPVARQGEVLSESIRRGAQDALHELRLERPPREAVTAAWLALREQAAQGGIHPSPTETPDEFAVTLARRLDDSAPDLVQLLTLYRRTRFGGMTPTAADVRTARRALESTVEELA